MRRWLVDHLVCPEAQTPLELVVHEEDGEHVISGELVAPNGRKYPIERGIPRFVETHYAENFGLQWNIHKTTQIDKIMHTHSAERFWGETGFDAAEMKDRLVLEGGCGSGRFVDIAASTGAKVIGVDLSSAVDASHANFYELPNVAIVQASLFDLPFRPGTFDFVYCLGVIQHTPDPLRALRAVASMGKSPGGKVGVFWYKLYWYTYLHQKYWLRPFLKGMDNEKLYRFVSWYAPKLLEVSRLLCKIPGFEKISDRLLPVANRDYIPGLTEEERVQWSILDTFDWYSPTYDKPQTWKAVRGVLEEYGYRCERAPHERSALIGERQ